mmetsp:Transcript_83126/g.201481  ORF Transcript_83126/g.201481 Transcript_83126/m.201481 type:complete len:289 (+) Transcript_83126:604-1470(+)
MNNRATSMVSVGSVALNSATCTSRGSDRIMSCMSSRKPSSSISSASSRTTNRTSRTCSAPSRSMCSSRPGVAITTWAPSRRARRSAPTRPPPTSSCTVSPFTYSPIDDSTLWLCRASSRVGLTISTCVARTDGSSSCSAAIENAPVLPVPDCAWAIVSRPFRSGNTALPWIGLGRSNPRAKMPRSTSSRRPMSSNDSTASVTLGVNSPTSAPEPSPSPVPAPAPPVAAPTAVRSGALSSSLSSGRGVSDARASTRPSRLSPHPVVAAGASKSPSKSTDPIVSLLAART